MVKAKAAYRGMSNGKAGERVYGPMDLYVKGKDPGNLG